MAGGTIVLAIIGLVALLAAGCELIRTAWRRLERGRLVGIDLNPGPAPDYPCPWPQAKPEVEALRRGASL